MAVKVKDEGKCIYTALYLTLKALRRGSYSFTCIYTNACLYLVTADNLLKTSPPPGDTPLEKISP